MDKICTPPCSSPHQVKGDCYDSPGTYNKINQNLVSLFRYFNMLITTRPPDSHSSKLYKNERTNYSSRSTSPFSPIAGIAGLFA